LNELGWHNKWAVGQKNKKQSMAFQKDGHITWINGLLYVQKQKEASQIISMVGFDSNAKVQCV
jgi:hypothetical protein